MLLRYMDCNYFCLLDFPKSQLKPANLHKQNGHHFKRVFAKYGHYTYVFVVIEYNKNNINGIGHG